MINNTTQHDTTQVQDETTLVKDDTTRVQHATTRVQHETTRVQNNIKFTVTVKTEPENLKATVCCSCVPVFLFIEIILIVSFFRFETSYEKVFE